jgi:hypothetical protein
MLYSRFKKKTIDELENSKKQESINISDINKYLDSNDGRDLVPYIPFVSMISEGVLRFEDFENYSAFRLFQYRRSYNLGVHIKNKYMNKLEEQYGSS